MHAWENNKSPNQFDPLAMLCLFQQILVVFNAQSKNTSLSFLLQWPFIFAKYVAEFHQGRLNGHVMPSNNTNLLKIFADGIDRHNTATRALRCVDNDESIVTGLLQHLHHTWQYGRPVAVSVCLKYHTFHRLLKKCLHLHHMHTEYIRAELLKPGFLSAVYYYQYYYVVYVLNK